MEILDDKFQLDIDRADLIMNDASSYMDLVERLFSIFSLTKEERLRAGIYVGIEGREWIEKSNLFFPLQDLEEL